MEKRFAIMLVLIVLALVYLIGYTLAEQCTQIDEFRACWKTVDVTLTSDLCPNPSQPCLATAQAQQHNAITDVLLQSCEKTKANSYSDQNLNKRIEEVMKTYSGYDVTAQQLCEQPGLYLTRQSYG